MGKKMVLLERFSFCRRLSAVVKNCFGIGSSYEKIGRILAENCLTSNFTMWEKELLKHNLPEIKKITDSIKSTLFEI
jgi:hypothetical protein